MKKIILFLFILFSSCSKKNHLTKYEIEYKYIKNLFTLHERIERDFGGLSEVNDIYELKVNNQDIVILILSAGSGVISDYILVYQKFKSESLNFLLEQYTEYQDVTLTVLEDKEQLVFNTKSGNPLLILPFEACVSKMGQ